MSQPLVIFSTDSPGTDNTTVRDVSWAPVRQGYSPRGGDNRDIVCSGWLLGDKDLRKQVREILDDSTVSYVPVSWTNYTFSEDRNTPADVVAAMYSTGMGRGVLNDDGWDILNEALPELTDPDNNRGDVIY